MLQIVTRRYFAEGVEVHETPQRGVLYTNRLLMRRDVVRFPVGELAPSAQPVGGVYPTAVTVVEYLEGGDNSVLIATSGEALIDDLAAFLSFALNAIFTQDHDLAHRLVPAKRDEARPYSAATMFDGTFDPAEYVSDDELERARAFMTELLDLQRPQYEAAMRAIRRIVRATQRAEEDPSIAYTDIVAALESLGAAGTAAAVVWDDIPGGMRTKVDSALQGVPSLAADGVRNAIAGTHGVRLARQFKSFVTDHVGDDYFRDEAVGVRGPLRRLDLNRVLERAYEVRSRNVHTLAELPPEAWVVGGRADTVSIPNLGLILTIQGLARVARHVVREFVRRAPRGLDPAFDWRTAIPGQIRMQWAPQYWLWQPDGLNKNTATRYFQGLASQFVQHDPSEPIADMREVLEVIERSVNGYRPSPARTAMLGIYSLWHHRMAPQFHRPKATTILRRNSDALTTPSMIAFVTALLIGTVPDWSVDEWQTLSDERIVERSGESEPVYAPALDAALHACATDVLWEAGRTQEACAMAARAVEEAPGNKYLRLWEAGTPAGEIREIDLARLLYGEMETELVAWPVEPVPSA